MGLYITKKQLHHSSGLDEKIIDKDIKDGVLQTANDKGELIWYLDAINYVCDKWNNGLLMYDPNNGSSGQKNFGERLLGLLDDGMSSKQIKKLRLID